MSYQVGVPSSSAAAVPGPSTSARAPSYSGSSASSSDSEPDDFEGWEEDADEAAAHATRSLFEEGKFLPTPEEALAWDREKFGFDLKEVAGRLALDFHQSIRLVNYIRSQCPPAADLAKLTGQEAFLSADEYLVPVIPDDPLLQLELDSDDWSDDEGSAAPAGDLPHAQRKIRELEAQLAQARGDLSDFRQLVQTQLRPEAFSEAAAADRAAGDAPAKPERDDDTHYFQSYSSNDIHEIMLKDHVRTASYAQFILSNPKLFKGATVLDVGCGSGILSLFAARAGAKKVFAIDASEVVEKARRNIKDNGAEGVITVIRGKVEEITLPVDKVDIVISEWMGYFLLYEAMLDSVLVARDRFLRPGGVLAPSQCRIMLGAVQDDELVRDKVLFWSDIYGFNMSSMASEVYDEAMVDVVSSSALITSVTSIKELPISTIQIPQLSFRTPFTIRATRAGTVHAFLGYFDTFFTPSGEPVPDERECNTVDPPKEETFKGPDGGKEDGEGREVSFTTGPQGTATHWKQTLFLLRQPIEVKEGTTISGTFHCLKSTDNSRELDVEIHYSVQGGADSAREGKTEVGMFKVR